MQYRFAHHSLDCFVVAREALTLGHALVAQWPRGYGVLGDQLRRALLGSYLQLSEAAARAGADRTSRFRCARAEANEAAAAVEAAVILGLSSAAQGEQLLGLLDRLCAMLTRLGGFGRK
jgi:four helix bundle protein